MPRRVLRDTSIERNREARIDRPRAIAGTCACLDHCQTACPRLRMFLDPHNLKTAKKVHNVSQNCDTGLDWECSGGQFGVMGLVVVSGEFAGVSQKDCDERWKRKRESFASCVVSIARFRLWFLIWETVERRKKYNQNKSTKKSLGCPNLQTRTQV